MWPKAFAQLIELAPHISRLVPLADRFLQNKTTPEDNAHQALEAVSSKMQAELGRIALAQGELSKQIHTLSDTVTSATSDTRATETALRTLEAGFAAVVPQGAALKAQLTAMEGRLAAMDAHLGRVSERVRLGPVVLLLVLTNLILLAALIVLLMHRR